MERYTKRGRTVARGINWLKLTFTLGLAYIQHTTSIAAYQLCFKYISKKKNSHYYLEKFEIRKSSKRPLSNQHIQGLHEGGREGWDGDWKDWWRFYWDGRLCDFLLFILEQTWAITLHLVCNTTICNLETSQICILDMRELTTAIILVTAESWVTFEKVALSIQVLTNTFDKEVQTTYLYNAKSTSL